MTLTEGEREWLDSWEPRCDADPALRRHDGYVEMFECILAHRLGRTLLDASEHLSRWTEGPDRSGTARFRECCRDTYSLAIEEASSALREQAQEVKL